MYKLSSYTTPDVSISSDSSSKVGDIFDAIFSNAVTGRILTFRGIAAPNLVLLSGGVQKGVGTRSICKREERKKARKKKSLNKRNTQSYVANGRINDLKKHAFTILFIINN